MPSIGAMAGPIEFNANKRTAQDTALLAWDAVTTPFKLGPLQSDRTVTDSAVNEYHVWPASAGTSWTLLAIRGFPS